VSQKLPDNTPAFRRQALATTQVENVPTCAVCGFVDGLGGAIGQPAPLHLLPEVVHRVQLWRRFGQEAQLDAQLPSAPRRKYIRLSYNQRLTDISPAERLG
jgi:hypothetical protein